LARASRDTLRNLRLIVLSAGIPGKVEDTKLEDLERTQELHAELARRSTKGRRRIVENSSHRIPLEAPESIIEAICEIVGEVRQIGIGAAVTHRPLPHHRAYGSVHGGSRSYALNRLRMREDQAIGSRH
jgi:hypothetical protein